MYLILYRWCCIGNEKKKTPQNLFKMNIVIRFYMILLILYFIVLNPFLYSTYIAPETIKKSFYFFFNSWYSEQSNQFNRLFCYMQCTN